MTVWRCVRCDAKWDDVADPVPYLTPGTTPAHCCEPMEPVRARLPAVIAMCGHCHRVPAVERVEGLQVCAACKPLEEAMRRSTPDADWFGRRK